MKKGGEGGEVLLYGIPTNILLLNSNEAVPWQEVGYRGSSYWGGSGGTGVLEVSTVQYMILL